MVGVLDAVDEKGAGGLVDVSDGVDISLTCRKPNAATPCGTGRFLWAKGDVNASKFICTCQGTVWSSVSVLWTESWFAERARQRQEEAAEKQRLEAERRAEIEAEAEARREQIRAEEEARKAERRMRQERYEADQAERARERDASQRARAERLRELREQQSEAMQHPLCQRE